MPPFVTFDTSQKTFLIEPQPANLPGVTLPYTVTIEVVLYDSTTS